jgi:hypothetical protein
MLDVLGISRALWPYIVLAVSLPLGLVAAVVVVSLADARARAMREATSVESALRSPPEAIDMGHGQVPTLAGVANRLLFIWVCVAAMLLMQVLCGGVALW